MLSSLPTASFHDVIHAWGSGSLSWAMTLLARREHQLLAGPHLTWQLRSYDDHMINDQWSMFIVHWSQHISKSSVFWSLWCFRLSSYQFFIFFFFSPVKLRGNPTRTRSQECQVKRSLNQTERCRREARCGRVMIMVMMTMTLSNTKLFRLGNIILRSADDNQTKTSAGLSGRLTMTTAELCTTKTNTNTNTNTNANINTNTKSN